MDTIALIGVLLDVGMALFLVYAVYYVSQMAKRRSVSPVPPEPKPAPVKPAPAPEPSATVETPKVEPVKTVEPKPQSAAVEAPEPEPSRQKTAEAKPEKTSPVTEKKERGFNIIDIEGIGKQYAAKLHAAGIYTTDELLKAGATPHGRRDLSGKTGVPHEKILEWVNLSDLFRIKGIGEEYSDLLEEAGVDTVVELSHRNAANLHAKILEVNEAKKLVRRPPPMSSVEAWIEEAKSLPRVIEY